jgi:hypothetical protein
MLRELFLLLAFCFRFCFYSIFGRNLLSIVIGRVFERICKKPSRECFDVVLEKMEKISDMDYDFGSFFIDFSPEFRMLRHY